jgi:hypothetical protein
MAEKAIAGGLASGMVAGSLSWVLPVFALSTNPLVLLGLTPIAAAVGMLVAALPALVGTIGMVVSTIGTDDATRPMSWIYVVLALATIGLESIPLVRTSVDPAMVLAVVVMATPFAIFVGHRAADAYVQCDRAIA